MSAPKSSSVDDDRDAFSKLSAPKFLSTEDDLHVAWEKVVRNFVDASKANPSSEPTTIRQVLDNVNSQTADDTTKARAKGIVMNILSSVQILGEFVAGASSTAFPASQPCFNALNLVIGAVKRYHKIFEDLFILLERVSVFLGSLRIYFEEKNTDVNLDTRLRPTVYRVLEHFMEIMTLAIELMHRKSRLKLAAKEFFFGITSGVTDALGKLETLVSDCVNMQVAVIGQDLSKAARDIRTLDGKMDVLDGKIDSVVNIMGRREEQEKVQEMRIQLRKWLRIGEEDIWRNHHNTIRDQRTDETGDWLCKENSSFVHWCDANSDASNVFLVTADPDRGKSFLASAVIDHIEDPSFASGGFSSLAYSYYQATIREDSKASSQKNIKQSSQGAVQPALQATSRALCSIVWQLSEADEHYRDFVFEKHKYDACKMKAIEIWNELIISYSPSRRSSYFIVIDGIQKADRELLESMIKWDPRQKSLLRVRVFATSKSHAGWSNTVINHSLRISLDRVSHRQEFVPSIADVKKITNARLDKTSIFHDKAPQTIRIREQVFDVVTRQIQNEFARLSLVLNEIENCVNSRQIERILERIEESIEVNLGRQIRSLNSKLAPDEIKEVNALISWLEAPKTSFYFLFGTPCLLAEQYVDVKLESPRLTPLSERIAQRYSLLFEVDDDCIRWRYPEIQQYLKQDFEDQQILENMNKRRGKRSSKTDLEELDLLELVIRNNLSTVFGTRGVELFDQYELGEYFALQRAQHTKMICADEKSSRYSVLLICLRVLCEDMSPRAVNRLCTYSRRNLSTHLKWDEKQKLKAKENQAIGRLLVKLLRNDTVIDHWSQEASHGITDCFTAGPKGDPIWKWLKKMSRSEGPTDLEDKEWFSKLPTQKEDSSSAHWDYAIDRILDGWSTRQRDTWHTICYLSGKLEPKHVQVWLRDRHHKLDPILLIKRLMQEADTEYHYDDHKSWILKTCNDIIRTNADAWWALFYSAKVSTEDGSSADVTIEDDSSAETTTQKDQSTGSTNGLKEAISHLNTAKSSTTKDKDFHDYYWTRILPLLARCQILDLDMEGAMESYSEMMNDASSRGALKMSMLCSFKPTMIATFLELAGTKTVPGETNNWLHELIASVDSSEAALSVSLAAYHGKNWSDIHRAINKAVKQLGSEIANINGDKTAETDVFGQDDEDYDIWQKHKTQKLLKSVLASILWHRSDNAEDHIEALGLWQEVGATEISLRVLIKHSKAKTVYDLWNTDDLYDRYFKTAIFEVCQEKRDVRSSANIRSHFIAARVFMNLGDREAAERLISKLLENKDYGENIAPDEQLEEYGRACFALGEDQRGHDLFGHVTTHDFAKHEGCQQTCGPELPNAEAVVYLCRDCMCFLKPHCLNALENGVWTAGFCDPDHHRIMLPPPLTKDGRNHSAAMDLVTDVGIKHGWLEGPSDEELEVRENGVLEAPRSRASFHSIDEVTIAAQE
ncbi:hypothetical protein GT037_004846 [Alternaria burnsii]|uniref:Fungal STAND N-terminal Goodbye domain-containing protein n=1 Tax=Alternaria burnsii TaxID=1187904 RepID=A0A8H7B586_9PLEO|nr:uncharacterized protein GT037_004846 [Alternaria burnsii]KAF7676634.1 hypothetical protein GT037_004846 [Alternaria burnsii]